MTRLDDAKAFIQSHLPDPRFPNPIDIGVVLGSGLSLPTSTLKNVVEVPYADIPSFPQPKVAGHAGKLVLGQRSQGGNVALFYGRVHYYEGHTPDAVVFPIRLLRQLGATKVILTNAAGGINPSFAAGDIMLIQDHLNLTGMNPLRGENEDTLGPRFPDMSTPYAPTLQTVALQVAQETDVILKEGIYAGVSGPSYETPAEVRMLKALGADAVGMSTVAETIAANHCGLQVLGLSSISNLAAGLSDSPLSHEEVLAAGKASAQTFSKLLLALLEQL